MMLCVKMQGSFPPVVQKPRGQEAKQKAAGKWVMCYLLHPERAEDVHVVAGPTNKPGRVGTVVKEELDSAPRSCHPKDLCFSGSPVRATRILNRVPPFPVDLHFCATWPAEGVYQRLLSWLLSGVY